MPGTYGRRPEWKPGERDFWESENIYKADGADDEECRFHERMEGRRYAQPEAGFVQMNIIYPFIDRHLKTGDWTCQDDGSFVLNINGKNAYITCDSGELLASRWDGVQIYADSLYSLENFLLGNK